MDNEPKVPVKLNHLSIQDECTRIAQKLMPKVEEAAEQLLDSDIPDAKYKGILAWERIAEFSVAKKSKDNVLPNNTNIVINMTPARKQVEDTQDSEYIDISDQKEINNENNLQE